MLYYCYSTVVLLLIVLLYYCCDAALYYVHALCINTVCHMLWYYMNHVWFIGPAGTGKTESVKALGHQLGRFVLVFNCDEKFDFQVTGITHTHTHTAHCCISTCTVYVCCIYERDSDEEKN